MRLPFHTFTPSRTPRVTSQAPQETCCSIKLYNSSKNNITRYRIGLINRRVTIFFDFFPLGEHLRHNWLNGRVSIYINDARLEGDAGIWRLWENGDFF
jgi:hypothetical protein